MDFSSMIIKNIKHNIKNYTAYLLGNTLIQWILFMFFTLVFSEEFMEVASVMRLKGNFISVVVLMVAFSVVFIIFTTVSFTKYRGKEFGVYFTIGLTSKEIIKILCYENIIISLLSFIFATVSGSVFSKLFHMAIGKILKLDNISISLSIKAYGTILLISTAIFLFTTIYQIIFLKRYSVINILKSKVKKDVGSTRIILGIIGLIIFIASIITFKMSIKQMVKDDGNLLVASIIGTVVSVYLIIGFSMTAVVKVLRKFKGIYNNNILFLNSLLHRFASYRAVLYVVTLMVSGAMIFISISYGMYKLTEKRINDNCPYDIGFMVDNDTAKNKDIKAIATEQLGEVKNYIQLEGLNVLNIAVYQDICSVNDSNMWVISEENYISLGKKQLDLSSGEVLYSHIEEEGRFFHSDMIFDLAKKVPGDEKLPVSLHQKTPLDEYKKKRTEDQYMYVSKENQREQVAATVNNFQSKIYSRWDIIVVNNEDYEMMKEKLGEAAVTYDVLINLKDNQSYEGLKKSLNNKLGKKVSDTLTIKKEKNQYTVKENGFMLFLFSSMGMMFLIGSAAVLYFKTITSIEEDRERSKQLIKLGLTTKEINKLAMKELGAVFLVPPIIALSCIGYFFYTIFSVVNEGKYMWENIRVVFVVYSIIQIIFYILTSNRYKKQINK
ncbi:ABC transporter permease [Clostridium cellulovorans]|uniref:ABC3 transporter permease C-terminal domain-containing protein n=1 Tax=Clostridium cellulovorans (strain ATCC 35296 / DSM 3052 / OCM 3 / 743B) TaxID=573061 RepID=D9SU43_CLOC7|nr:ABC transporter permease [Clostridium cellulovorans]ADL50881.1 protein of unknown function DUF214 [Clostridium cellulovorans 743B]